MHYIINFILEFNKNPLVMQICQNFQCPKSAIIYWILLFIKLSNEIKFRTHFRKDFNFFNILSKMKWVLWI